MNIKQNNKEMMEWYDRHHAEQFAPRRKRKTVIMPTRLLKKQLPKKIIYGTESKEPIIERFYNSGWEQHLHSDGVITCLCPGWIYKRTGVQRECKHVREVYGKLNKKPMPEKTPKPDEIKTLANRLAELLLSR